MKSAKMSLVIFALVFIGIPVSSWAASQSYRISVHIPAIAGVNVPLDDPNAEIKPQKQAEQEKLDIREVVRDGEKIVLQTSIVK